ncbi:UNVERIFIED_CONTAM: hypothetical protein PYX00_002136 [Menopon gallinae]|uniref:Uncharacterized protein n=1 Tax=Menopon gallinae TaxID=328185 RepID=A0AAW2IGW9_9NEOP
MTEGLTMPRTILFVSLLACTIAATFACNGCVIKKLVVKPCPGTEKTNVIKMHVDNVVLTSDCKFKTSGSTNITKSVKTLDIQYQFQKGILKKNGQNDGCKDLEKSSKDKDSEAAMKMFGFPDKCPFEKQHKKYNKEMDVSKYKDKMHLMNGQSSGKVDMIHGDKGHSCYTFETVVDCKKA